MKLSHPAIGHRQRLRARFDKYGIKALQDYEILEMLLYNIIQYADTQIIAKRLLAKFGTLKHVLSADRESLLEVKGVGQKIADQLFFLRHAFSYLYQNSHRSDDALYRPQIAYSFYISLKEKSYESLTFLCFDRHFDLAYSGELTDFDDKRIILEQFDQILKCAKNHGAQYLCVAHNHPVEIAYPSVADQDFTYLLLKEAFINGIILLDHFIVSPYSVYSFFYDNLLGKMAKDIVFNELLPLNFTNDDLQLLFYPKNPSMTATTHPNVLTQLYDAKVDAVPLVVVNKLKLKS